MGGGGLCGRLEGASGYCFVCLGVVGLGCVCMCGVVGGEEGGGRSVAGWKAFQMID
jgi:hypothetical protein